MKILFTVAGVLVALLAFFASNFGFYIVTLAIGQSGRDLSESAWFVKTLLAKHARMPEVEPLPVPEVDAATMTPEILRAASKNWKLPVVIRGLLTDTKACKEWNFDYLEQGYGNETFLVSQIFPNGTKNIAKRSFSEFNAMYKAGEQVVIGASSSVFGRRPELVEDLTTPLDPMYMSREDVAVTQFFLTARNPTFLHTELGTNIFKQFQGSKDWVLVAPKYNYLLGPRPLVTGSTVATASFLAKQGDEYFKEYMKRIPRYATRVHAGDALVNEPWWWHEVRPVGDGVQMSVADRVKTLGRSITSSPVLTFLGVGTIIYNRIMRVPNQQMVATPEGIEDNIFMSLNAEYSKPATEWKSPI